MLFALICRLFESIVFLSPTEAFLDWYFAQAINKSADVCVLPCLLILDLCFLAMQRTISVMTLCNWVFMHWQAYLICILKICACCSCCGVQSNVDVVKGFRVSCGETKTPVLRHLNRFCSRASKCHLNIHSSSFHVTSVWCTCCCIAKKLFVMSAVAMTDAWILGWFRPVFWFLCAVLQAQSWREVLLWCPKASLQLLNKCGENL